MHSLLQMCLPCMEVVSHTGTIIVFMSLAQVYMQKSFRYDLL